MSVGPDARTRGGPYRRGTLRAAQHPDHPFAANQAEVVARFEVRFVRCIRPDGRPVGDLPQIAHSADVVIGLYRGMIRARAFDTKAIALQRTGHLGTYPPLVGEEAVGVAVAQAMRPEDVLVPGYRDQAAQLARGVTPLELFLYWSGDERGSDFAGPRRDFPVSIPIASHAPHAIGVALAMRIRREQRVAVCMMGDGATSKGDFSEALNVAGVMRLPVVFVVVNNQWAISVPRSAQTAAQTLAQKAIAAGIPGLQVDGNDAVALAGVLGEAVEAARGGAGPALIEAITYRLGDHTTVDDARRYRADAEVSAHWAEEPIARLRNLLVDLGIWGRTQEEALLAQVASEIADAVDALLATAPEAPGAMFEHLYAVLPEELEDQYSAVTAEKRHE
jgi:2-oxoisovalerate dehydrogenase E1 component alpha subunit